eukprot:764300-Hanusia_phi.AAC.6
MQVDEVLYFHEVFMQFQQNFGAKVTIPPFLLRFHFSLLLSCLCSLSSVPHIVSRYKSPCQTGRRTDKQLFMPL